MLLDKHIQERKTANLVCYELDIQEGEALEPCLGSKCHRPAFKLGGVAEVEVEVEVTHAGTSRNKLKSITKYGST